MKKYNLLIFILIVCMTSCKIQKRSKPCKECPSYSIDKKLNFYDKSRNRQIKPNWKKLYGDTTINA